MVSIPMPDGVPDRNVAGNGLPLMAVRFPLELMAHPKISSVLSNPTYRNCFCATVMPMPPSLAGIAGAVYGAIGPNEEAVEEMSS
jgi:hypothetical protein